MPLDGITLRATIDELKSFILNSKVERIYQPEKYEIIFHLRKPQANIKLLINTHPVLSHLCITKSNKTNPINPPPFCMLLRKYLEGGEVIGIKQKGLDRVVEITLNSWKEEKLTLYVEIMGKNSNMILTDENNKIIDSLRHVYPEMSRVRCISPGETYIYPPSQNKINIVTASESEIIDIFKLTSSKSLQNFLVENLEGFSGFLSYAIIASCGLNPFESYYDKSQVINGLLMIRDALLNSRYSPTIYLENNLYKDFLPFSFDIGEQIRYDSMSRMIEEFYYRKELNEAANDRVSALMKIIKVNLERCYRKLETLNTELESGKERDRYKEYADLIMANINNIYKGVETVRLQNILNNPSEMIDINLDPSLTPIENAQRYYKKYNKLKNSIKHIEGQIKDTMDEIEYLESELNNLQIIEDISEIDDIKSELESTGYIKNKGIKKGKTTRSKPRHFISSDGYDIFVGKNNIQNDDLTIHYASASDIWLHAKDIPGSHVIIKTNKEDIPYKTLLEAAELAAYFSKARKSSNVPVDYTIRKYVKKPSGAKPGKVIYTNQKTLYVTPTDEDIDKLSKAN